MVKKTVASNLAVLVLIALMNTPHTAIAGGLVVIVSAKSQVGTLSDQQVADIFLGKVTVFPNGVEATPIDQAETSSGREAFYTQLVKKPPAQLKAYWARMIFSGKSLPPKIEIDSAAVKKRIAGDLHTIGYIDKSMTDDTVKVVMEVGGGQ